MDSDEAPPPYSAVDPLLTQSNNGRNPSPALQRTTLRGGDAPLPEADAGNPISDPSILPFNSSSAVSYFVERPPAAVDGGWSVLEHHLTIYPKSQSKDFPRRPRCWNDRADQITQQDWDMFLKYLFPPHLGLASASGHLPRQLRAEIQRDRKDRPQETDEQRKMRIQFVIAEWNQYFFEPRATRIVFVCVTEPGSSPSSALCPRCYPAATRATQEHRSSPIPGTGSHWRASRSSDPANGAQPVATPAFAPGVFAYPNPPTLPLHPHACMPPFPRGGPHFPCHPRAHVPYHPHAHLARHMSPNWQHYQWGWQNQSSDSTAPGFGGFKGGPLSWISQIASQAQKYGERISEQAQAYGDQISAHAQYYGRQVEEQAMAHGRWIEDRAALGGRRFEHLGDVFAGSVGGDGNQQIENGDQHASYPNAITYSNPNLNDGSIEAPPQVQPARRSSVDSASSETSLTSLDSISTTSELSSSDLATIRAQLLSLNDHHDRDLYEAASDLRRQLDTLKVSRRQGHFPRRGSWRNRWWAQNPHNYGHHGGWGGSGGWGRWESPEEQQRNWAERKEMKKEMKATKKAFRDVLRRAREEQREKRREKRARRRQERRSMRDRQEEPEQEVPLDQRLANLELETRPENQTGNQPENPPAAPVASRSRAESTSSTAASEISIVSTPSSTSSESSGASAKRGGDKENSAKK